MAHLKVLLTLQCKIGCVFSAESNGGKDALKMAIFTSMEME